MQYVGLSVFCILIGLDLKVWSYSAGKPGDVIWSAILGTLGDTAYVAGSDSKTGPKPKGTGAHNLKIEEKAKQVKDGTIVSIGGRGYPPEVKIPTDNGLKSHRCPDILVVKSDGSLYVINVGKPLLLVLL